MSIANSIYPLSQYIPLHIIPLRIPLHVIISHQYSPYCHIRYPIISYSIYTYNDIFHMISPQLVDSIWTFPKIGVPPNHPIFIRIVHYKPSILLYPPCMETSISHASPAPQVDAAPAPSRRGRKPCTLQHLSWSVPWTTHPKSVIFHGETMGNQ